MNCDPEAAGLLSQGTWAPGAFALPGLTASDKPWGSDKGNNTGLVPVTERKGLASSRPTRQAWDSLEGRFLQRGLKERVSQIPSSNRIVVKYNHM